MTPLQLLLAKLQSYVYTNGIGLVTAAKLQEILTDIVMYAFHTDNFANDVRSVVIQDNMDGTSSVVAPSVGALKNYLIATFLVDNLTTNDSQKGLAASQGVVIQAQLDDIFNQLSNKAEQGDLINLDVKVDDIQSQVNLKASQIDVDALALFLQGQIDNKVEQSDIDTAVDALKDGVAAPGDTLQKLYNIIIGQLTEISVADIAARNALDITKLPTNVFVIDDGDGNWALYKATTLGVGATYVKLSDPDLLNAVMSNSQIKVAYESNPDTNAFTNALLSKLNAIEANANNYSHPNHSGDVASAGDGTTTIQAGVVSNSKLSDMPTLTIKGRATIGPGVPEDLTAAQVTDLLNGFTNLLKGLVPASGGGTTNYLRADGTWSNPKAPQDRFLPISAYLLVGIALTSPNTAAAALQIISSATGAVGMTLRGGNNQDDGFSFGFTVPGGYVSGGLFQLFVTTAYLLGGNVKLFLAISVTNDGDSFTTIDETNLSNTFASVPLNTCKKIEITPTTVFQAGDNVTVKVWRDPDDAADTTGLSCYVQHVNFKYQG